MGYTDLSHKKKKHNMRKGREMTFPGRGTYKSGATWIKPWNFPMGVFYPLGGKEDPGRGAKQGEGKEAGRPLGRGERQVNPISLYSLDGGECLALRGPGKVQGKNRVGHLEGEKGRGTSLAVVEGMNKLTARPCWI